MLARSRLFLRTACALSMLGVFHWVVAPGVAISRAGELEYTGVDLSTAEFGASVLPGVYGTNYTYPTSQEIDYYTSKGMNTFRLPFRWERMQTTPDGPLDPTQLGYMDTFVNYATSKGDNVLIDPHNFERYYPLSSNFQSSNQGLIGGSTADTQSSYNSLNGTGSGANVVITNDMFANFWGQMAAHYKNNSHVIFDLMNEPNSVSASQVVASDNAAIAAIRAAGANNLVLIEGTSYTGAWTWTSSGNAAAIVNPTTGAVNIVDPANNWAVEMHQYFDSDGSGTHSTINNNDPTTGMQRLQAATAWLQQYNIRGFLGEFAVANSIINPVKTDTTTLGNATIDDTLNYLQANSNTWMGWTWWGGGPSNWWGNYMFALDPTNLNNPTDQHAMTILSQFLPMAGDFNRDGHVDASDVQAMEAALSNLNGWYASETALGLNSTQEKIIADVNKDGVVNNADLQALLNLLKSGGGSDSAVPEPASLVMLGLAACFLPVMRRRHRCFFKNDPATIL
jgi:endoglucanase